MNRLLCLISLFLTIFLIKSYSQSDKQSKLLPVSSSEVINFHDLTAPIIQLPYDPFLNNPLHDETDIINAICFLPGVNSDNNPNDEMYYVGQHPVYCQAIVHDRNGNILFQIVDNNIYNRFGESFINTQTNIYNEAHYWLHQGFPNVFDNSDNISITEYEANYIGEYLNRTYCIDPTQFNPEGRIVLTPPLPRVSSPPLPRVSSRGLAVYFVSFAVVEWRDVFTKTEYKNIFLDSLSQYHALRTRAAAVG